MFSFCRCRKSHLVNGSNFENNTDEKSCTFTAKFKKHGDVPFTVLFGNDVVHPIPAAIKTENVIMTSSIKNVLPLNVGELCFVCMYGHMCLMDYITHSVIISYTFIWSTL